MKKMLLIILSSVFIAVPLHASSCSESSHEKVKAAACTCDASCCNPCNCTQPNACKAKAAQKAEAAAVLAQAAAKETKCCSSNK